MDDFLSLLASHGIRIVCDVRSHPYSRYNPQFNQETLAAQLKQVSRHYIYLGHGLGGRQMDHVDANGRVDYARVAQAPAFLDACAQLKALAIKQEKIVLMCAEKNPALCHRSMLISNYLPFECEVRHILSDGSLLSHGKLHMAPTARALF
jgi:uncharacterized protein (DUF488 family)